MRIDYESQNTIFLENNPTYHAKKEHRDAQYHFVREMVENNKVLVEKVDQEYGRLFEKFSEYNKVHLVQRSDEHYFLEPAMEVSGSPVWMQGKKQVGYCWVVFSLQVELVDRIMCICRLRRID